MDNSNYAKRRLLIVITLCEITSANFRTYSMIGMTKNVKKIVGNVIHISVIDIPTIPFKNIRVQNF